MNKEWRDIPGYEGLYQASSMGEIRSLPRNTTGGRIMKPQINNSGYARVSITMGKSKYLYVHHLMALAFIGSRPEGHDVNHINGDKLDNRAINLEYVTRTENMRHARRLGLQDNRGEKHYASKLDRETVIAIRKAHNLCGVSAEEMAVNLGVSPRTVKDALIGLTWRHVQYE